MVASATVALDMARTVLGKTEGRDRAALIDYMKTGGQNIDPATRAWCADFVNATLQRAGYSGTGSGMARSFLEWGNAVQPGQVQPGDIGVFPRGSNPAQGHVGFVERVDPATGMVTMISGNAGPQGAVQESQYALNTALGFRRATEQAKAMTAAGYSPEQIKAAFLTTIASGESPGYDVMYGGQKFTDYSRHPHQMQPIFDPKHPGQVIGHADVAGRYQFKGATWDELQKKYGYKDFSPTSQDAAAWQYASDIFKQKTGGSLEEALASGDPGRINAAAQVLNQTWSSLPGGKEQAKGYGSQTFADVYNKALNAAGGAGVHPPNPTVGTGSTAVAATEPLPPFPYGQQRQKNAGEVFGEGIAKMGAQPEPASSMPGIAKPQITMSTLPSMPTVDPQQAEMRRQRLAMMMQRLNQGSLV